MTPETFGAGEPGVPSDGGSERLEIRLDRCLQIMCERGASDLQLIVGQAPSLRIDRRAVIIRTRIVSEADFERCVRAITPALVWKGFEAEGDGEFVLEVKGLARFRVHLFKHLLGFGAVFRLIPARPYGQQQLGLPASVYRMARFYEGLVIIAGPAGSGRSTTLASLVDELNGRRAAHVLTLEHPVEYSHMRRRGLVTQQDVGLDKGGTARVLERVLHSDVDVLVLGDLDTVEKIQLAIEAAESDMLVFATMHARSVERVIERLVTSFPIEAQKDIRPRIAQVLRGVVAQQLVPRQDRGNILALELVYVTSAFAAFIRQGQLAKVAQFIGKGREQGMVRMDDALVELVAQGVISADTAYEASLDRVEMNRILRRDHQAHVDAFVDDEDILAQLVT